MNPAVDPFDALVRKVGSDGVSAAIEATRESLGLKCNPLRGRSCASAPGS